MTAVRTAPAVRVTRNKVPDVGIHFWLLKLLCVPVGLSWAHYVEHTLRFGLPTTAIVFSAALGVSLLAQFRLGGYLPGYYWLTVLLASVVASLLTDRRVEHLSVTTAALGLLLVIVLFVWRTHEQTLSIRSIITTRRETFYWLTVLVTFGLGSAAGNWTSQLSGWGPGSSIVLPTALLASLLCAWRLGASPTICFWTAFVLTGPLGANVGAFLSSDHPSGGLDLGTLTTSMLFLAIMLATVAYLSVTGVDRTEFADLDQ